MSYCRWSSDDFQCDLYIYEDVNGGFTTHVAGNRVIYKVDLPDPVALTQETASQWAERHYEIMQILDDGEKIERVPIDLPHAGETFNDETAGECADRVESLIALGYRVPDYVVKDLRAVQAIS
jgi:hypothetical protein